MTVLRSLMTRAIDASDFNKAIFLNEPSHAGIAVDGDKALTYIPVWACVRLLSETVAMLPVKVFRPRGLDRELVPRQPGWLTTPNKETDGFTFWERIMTSLNADGNAYIALSKWDSNAQPTEMWNVPPQDIEPKRDERTNEIYYLFQGRDRFSRYGPATPQGDILHIKAFSNGGLKGLNPISAARQGIGLGLVAEKFGSKFFGSGQSLSGVIEVDGNLSNDLAKALKDNWVAHHSGADNADMPGVLSGGAKWKPTAIAPEAAQFLETRKFQRSEIASFFRVPPHMIGDVERSTSWGTGIEQQSIGFVVYSILPWIARLESAFNQLTPRGQFVKWNVTGLLRGDAKSRFEAYASAIQHGWMTRNEARHLEDMNSLEGLDEPLTPLNMAGVTEPGEEPDDQPPSTD